jgi:hypothetical protein
MRDRLVRLQPEDGPCTRRTCKSCEVLTAVLNDQVLGDVTSWGLVNILKVCLECLAVKL